MFKNEIKCNMYSFLCNNKKFLTPKQIFFSIKAEKNDTKTFLKLIEDGVSAGYIKKNKEGKLKLSDDISYGHVQIGKRGEFFAHCNKEKYLLVNDKIKNVLHGDMVLMRITDRFRLEAKMLFILKHKGSKIRGTVMDGGNFAFLIPDDNTKYPSDVFLSKRGDDIDFEQYDRVIVQVNEYDTSGKPNGKVLYKLSNSDIIEDPLQMIVEKYQIEKDFSSEVKRKAASIKNNFSKTTLGRAVDLTGEPIFTIDGIHSKDLDDAISIKKFGNNYELGVYIADVSNYVEENSVIDRCARERGTSYYFIDKVIPMLPVELSNGVCSLNPNEPKLCLGIKMIINKNGDILDKEFFECIISSKKKFSYEEINAYLSGTNPSFEKENANLLEYLRNGLELSNILNKKRITRNAIMFEFDAVDFEIDVDGTVSKMFPYERGPANKMIEEFMIAANETVAELFNEIQFPFVYRIHDEPFEEKLQNFFSICRAYGFNVPDDPTVDDIGKILESIKDMDLKRGMSMNLITTMKQAKYSEDNIGHFGLGSRAYCHFTSPIRRYPDLVNHRMLKRYIRKTLNSDVLRDYMAKSIEQIAKECSRSERNAARAEEEYDKIKSLEYFLNNSSNEYEGIIYSITSKGINILVDNCISGFVRMKGMQYNTDTFTGEYNGNTYKIGDRIKVFFSEFDTKDKRLLFCQIDSNDKVSEDKAKC